jgi:hypothetical protein
MNKIKSLARKLNFEELKKDRKKAGIVLVGAVGLLLICKIGICRKNKRNEIILKYRAEEKRILLRRAV